MRRVAPLVVVLAGLLIAPTADAGPASSTCTLHPQQARLEVTIFGFPNVLSRVGDDVRLNGSSCDGATVHNTDVIDVTAPSGSQNVTLRILMLGGLFEPGATLGSVIPIHVDLTQVPLSRLYVNTGKGPQHIEIDGTDIDLDADAPTPQADILLSDMSACLPDCASSIQLGTGPGADEIIQVRRDPATSSFIRAGDGDDVVHVQDAGVIGGDGDDLLLTRQGASMFGRFGDDLLIGSSDPDGLYGDQGNDRIYAAGGKDVIRGSAGRDMIVAGARRDRISGGSYGDWIWGGRGRDVFDGGDGDDRCQPNRGDNLSGTNCEQRLSTPPPPP
jgi:hypothetical protein